MEHETDNDDDVTRAENILGLRLAGALTSFPSISCGLFLLLLLGRDVGGRPPLAQQIFAELRDFAVVVVVAVGVVVVLARRDARCPILAR